MPTTTNGFSTLPISDQTKKGLKKAFFVDMTDIQAKSIPTSLEGHDILAAAKTGSGKTLAFLVPILEVLYRRKWGPTDGLGALIISPTRELAVQIFQVLRSIGGYHSFSAGLVIGGKNLKDEKVRLSRMNILVATPGRLLQHLDQTVGFECSNLQMLVLDEADRILDMGFFKTLSALLGHLPKSRQTLLFSATQTQSIASLARLSLKDPVSIGIGKETDSSADEPAIPSALEHHYTLCPLDQKLDVLWGFIRTHLKSKVLVFLSSGKQVRFVYEVFCKMQPGISLLHIHGKQKQSARLAVYERFTTSEHSVLFATDVAARGLDFPSVEWVVQLDAPEDADTYIHRVGRTARYDRAGKGLLLLLPSEEEGMKAALEKKSITIGKIKIKASKTKSIQNNLQKLAFEDPEIKYLGQKAFVSYLRSIHLQKDKSIFKVKELPVERFAESLGLPGAPNVKFLDKEKKAAKTRGPAPSEAGPSQTANEKDGRAEKSDAVRTKYDRMFQRTNQDILSTHYSKLVDRSPSPSADSSEDDFITLRRVDHDLPEIAAPDEEMHQENLSKRQQRLGKAKRLLKDGGRGKKLIFDEEGNPHELYELQEHQEWVEGLGGDKGVDEQGKQYAVDERTKMNVTDTVDKREAREKKLEKKRKRKERERQEEEGDGGIPKAVVIPQIAEEDLDPSIFDHLPTSGSESDQDGEPQKKRHKSKKENFKEPPVDDLDDEEELALKLLRR